MATIDELYQQYLLSQLPLSGELPTTLTPYQRIMAQMTPTMNPYTGAGVAIGGYDPALYGRMSGSGLINYGRGGGGGMGGSSDGGSAGDLDVGGNKNTQVESLAEQSARNQQLNDFLTNISKFSLTGLLSSGLVGLLGGKPQSPAPVEDVGTYSGKNPVNDFGFATQAEADAINAAAAQQEAQQQSVNQALNDLSARQETQMNAAPDTGGGGYSASDYGGYSGSETQSSGEAYANFKGGLIDKVAGPNPPGPDDGTGMLQLGEYVIKKSAVKKYGTGLLDMINAGKIPAKKMKSLLG
jgi:hypothetical protein